MPLSKQDKDKLLFLIERTQIAEFFEEIDRIGFSNEALEKLRKEFILNKTDADFYDKLKVAIDYTSNKPQEPESINAQNQSKIRGNRNKVIQGNYNSTFLIAFLVSAFLIAGCFVIYLFKNEILGSYNDTTVQPPPKDTTFVLPKTPEVEEKTEPKKVKKISGQNTENQENNILKPVRNKIQLHFKNNNRETLKNLTFRIGNKEYQTDSFGYAEIEINQDFSIKTDSFKTKNVEINEQKKRPITLIPKN